MNNRPDPHATAPEWVDPFHDHDHDACASAVMESAERQTVTDGIRLTPVRRRTLEILLESHRAMGAYEVLQRLSEDGFGNQPPVAYRALDFLVEHGLAHRVRRLNAYAACLAPGHEDAPVFLICRGCDKIAESNTSMIRQALETLAADNDFRMERSTVEVLGICAACRAGQAAEQMDETAP